MGSFFNSFLLSGVKFLETIFCFNLPLKNILFEVSVSMYKTPFLQAHGKLQFKCSKHSHHDVQQDVLLVRELGKKWIHLPLVFSLTYSLICLHNTLAFHLKFSPGSDLFFFIYIYIILIFIKIAYKVYLYYHGKYSFFVKCFSLPYTILYVIKTLM